MGKFNFDNDDFLKTREEAEKFYSTINSVFCPYLGEKIAFNSKGLKHYFTKLFFHFRTLYFL